MASNENSHVPPCITPKLSRIAMAPTCAMSRYRRPALRISGMPCCAVTRKYELSAMVSHATMKA